MFSKRNLWCVVLMAGALLSCGQRQKPEVEAAVAKSGNPIFDGWYADPEGIIYGDKYWIYPTWSDVYENQVFFDCFSSKDLVNWTKHSAILDTAEVKWAKKAMWAPGVISNMQTNEKQAISSPLLFPKASFCDPSVSVSVPAWHTAAGAADIMSHTFEQYLVCEGNDVSDGFCETILKTVIKNAPICIKDPTNLEARSAMMLASSFGCCGLLAIGNMPSPWPCHAIEHEISAWHDITHGVGLAIITPHWMRYSLNEKTAPRFAQYAVNVWGMDPKGDVMELANAAIDKTAEFFASIGIPQRLSEVGVDDSHFEAMADHIPTCWWPLSGALRPIDKAGVIEILRSSL